MKDGYWVLVVALLATTVAVLWAVASAAGAM